MVAVVSGSGLGLFGSSVSALGGIGASGNAGVGRGNDRVYVNSATGNLVVQSQDERLSALGLDLGLIRTYNSQGLLDDDNGDNWRLGVHQRVHGLTGTVNTAGSTVTKEFGDGREVVYSYDNGRGLYVSTDGEGAHDTLSNTAGSWTWTDGSSRSTETYDSNGRLTASKDGDGNTVSYTYTGQLLTQITDASGQVTYLDYSGNNLSQIRVVSDGQTQTLTRYTYDTSNRLNQVQVDLSPENNSVADNNVYTTTYTYDGTSRRIASITQADGSSVSFAYQLIDGQYRVVSHTDALGRVTTLTYGQATGGSGGTGTSTVSADTHVLSTTEEQGTAQNYNLNPSALSGAGNPSPVTQTYRDDANQIIGTLHADGSFTSYEYREGQPVTIRNHVNAPVTPLWSQDFSQDASGMSALSGFTTLQDGKLTVSTRDDVADTWYKSTGDRVYDFDDHVAFRSEVTIADDRSGMRFMVGAENQAGTRRLAALFYGDVVRVSHVDGTWTTLTLGAARSGVTYVVEVVTSAQGSTLYVYEKGQDRADGMSYSTTVTDWGTARSFYQTYSNTTNPINSVQLDNMSEASASGALVGSWIAAPSPQDTVTPLNVLQNLAAVPVPDGTAGQWRYYTLDVPEGQSNLTVFTRGGTGKSGIYLRRGAEPTQSTKDYAFPYGTGNTQSLSVTDPAAGRWYIGILIETDISGVEVQAQYQSDTHQTQVLTSEGIHDIGGETSQENVRDFSFEVPTGTSNFRLDLVGPPAGLAGFGTSTTLMLRYGVPPTSTSDADTYTFGSGATRSKTVTSPTAGTWYARLTISGRTNDTRLVLNTNVHDTPPSVSAAFVGPAKSGDSVSLSATGSDAEGAVTYEWTQVGGPSVTLSNGTSANASFTAPVVLGPTVLTFRVKATDAYGAVDTDLVRVVVNNVAPYYSVPAAATWQSIANALYGVNSSAAGAALQTALGSPALTAGALLRHLPSTLSVAAGTVTVPAYYTVQTGDTWASITQTIYGTSDDDVVAALKTALGNPTLSTGVKLVVPLSLSYSTSAQSASADTDLLSTTETQTSSTDHGLISGAPSTTDTQTTTTSYNLSEELTSGSGGWSAPGVLESSGTAAADPKVLFDSSGNGIAIWREGGDLYVRHYTASTDTWSTATALDSRSETVYAPALAVKPNGDALVAWVQSDGTANSLYVRSYTASTGTWGTAQVLESSSQPVDTTADSLSVAMMNGYAAVAWLQSDGTRNNLYVAKSSGSGWGSAMLVENTDNVISQPTMTISSAGEIMLMFSQIDAGVSKLYLTWSYGTSWGTPYVVDASSSPASDPTYRVDAAKDEIGISVRGNDIRAYRHVNSTGVTTWTSIDTRSETPYAPSLALDITTGDAIAAWVQSDGTANSVYVSQFTKSTGSWSTPQLLESSAQPVNTASGSVAVSISGSYAAVAWLQSDGTRDNLYSAVYSGGSWGTATLVENSTAAAAQPSIAIDGSGKVTLLWQQSDGTVNSIYQARYSATSGAAYYEVPASATWQSIANTLYGVNSPEAGAALQTALGSPSLTTGAHLTGLPATLSVTTTTTVTVPAYYEVPAGATWQSIANTLYGVNSAEAGSALQTALGSPTLTTGTHLTNLPATLSVTTTSTVTVPAYYTVQSGDTWASITQTIYGTSDAAAVSALQTQLGSPTLTVGVHLTVPLTLSYGGSSGGSGSGPTQYLQTEVHDALGGITTYVQDAQGRLVGVLSPTVGGTRLETRYSYDADGNVSAITEDPNGLNRVTAFTYDANGNVLVSRDSLGNTVSRTYDANNQLLTSTQYLVRDADGAGSGQPSVPLTTRYAYDSEGHLRFVISAQGRVTEHQYGATGNRTATLKYVAGLYTAAGFTEATLQSWTQSQDRTQLERLDYTYDFRGTLSRVSAYATTDATGAGTGTASITQFVYDQRGQLLQTIEARGSATTADPDTANLPYATTYAYDGLGRVKSATQWVSGTSLTTTITAYDDVNRKTTTTLANGLITTRTYNAAGELMSLANGSAGAPNGLGTTTYAYDANGRLRMTTDPTGVKQFVLYDAAGRQIATVDGDGTLTQFVFNRAGEGVKTIQYAQRLDSATLASLVDGSGNPADLPLATLIAAADDLPAQDRITRTVYNAAGQVVYRIDAAGAVTQYFYDGAGRVTDEVRYATTVTIARATEEVLESAVTVTASADDRRTRHFYDKDGKLLGTLDGAGYLVEYQYDPAGYLFQQIGYATKTNASYWTAGTLDQLRPATEDPEGDIHSRFFYDGQGRQIAMLDAEGYLTETGYDEAGHVLQTVRYDRQLPYTPGTSTLATLKAAATATPAPTTHTTIYQYDGAGRLVQETNYQGTVTAYAYDSVGQLIGTIRAQGTSEARTTQVKYDFLGRVLQELTAEGSAQLTGGLTQAQIDEVWDKYGVTYTYDAAGRRTSATQRPDNTQTNVTHYYYDDDGQLRFAVNAQGERTEYRYNAFGQVTQTLRYANRIDPTGLTGGRLTAGLTTTLTANADASKDALTQTTYTLTGRVEQTRVSVDGSTAHDQAVTRSYTAFGELKQSLEQIDPTDGTRVLQRDYQYDQRGLLLQSVADAAGLNVTQARQYDAFGRLTRLTDGRSNTSQIEYDRLGRQVATVDALTGRRVTTYDAFSRVLTTRDALLNTTSYSYNDATRQMTVTTPENISVVTTYTRHGQTLSVTAAGRTTHYEYDENGQLTQTSDDLGTLESRTYDRSGRQLTQVDARNVTTRFTYDAANRQLSRIVDDGGLALTTTTTYNGLGQVTEVSEPGGRVTRTTYDRAGQVTEVAVDPAGLNLRTAYTYDRQGHTLTVTEGVGSTNPRRTQYLYDTLGRRTEQIVDPTAVGGTLNLRTQYKYDDNGNLTRKIDANGNSTWYVYDANDRQSYTIDALGDVTQTVYDAEDRVIATRQYATPIVAATVATFGDVVTTVSVTANATTDRFTQSIYDKDGRERYRIDAMGTVTEHTFDAAGNVTRERTYAKAVTAGTTYTTATTLTAALTSAGNSTTTIGAQDRVSWSAYDVRNELVYRVTAVGQVGGQEMASVVRYAYDAAGNLTATTAYATLRATSAATDRASLDTWAATAAVANHADNRTTRYWYDRVGREVFKLDGQGYLTRTVYNDATRISSVVLYATAPTVGANDTLTQLLQNSVVTGFNTSRDRVSTTERDVAGRIVRVFDALTTAASTAYEEYRYDAVGNRIATVDPRGVELAEKDSAWAQAERVRLGYSTLAASLTAAQRTVLRGLYTTTRQFDAAGREIAVTDALGNVTRKGYDGAGNLVKLTDARNQVGYYYYDAKGQVRYQIDPMGYVTERRYDALGNVTDELSYAKTFTGAYSEATTLAQIATGLQLDAAKDRRLSKTYYQSGLVHALTHHGTTATYTESYTYNAFGQKQSYLDKTTALYEYRYNARGDLIQEILPEVEVVTAVIPTVTTQSMRLENRYDYNAFGNQVLKQEAFGTLQQRDTRTTYDRQGRDVLIEQPAFDVFDPITKTTTSKTPTIQKSYDAAGNLVLQIAENGGRTVNYYDTRNLKVASVDADNALREYEYDSVGNLIAERTYDMRVTGTQVATTRPTPINANDYRELRYLYNANNLRVRTQSREETLYSYALLQQRINTGVLNPNGYYTASVFTRADYDANGNVVRTIDGNNLPTYQYYDADGNRILQVDADGYVIHWTYNAQGQLVRETKYAGQLNENFRSTLDVDTIVDTILGAIPAGDDRITEYDYDQHGRIKTERKISVSYATVDSATGVLTEHMGDLETHYEYDGNDHCTAEVRPGAHGRVDYTYDALGRKKQEQGPQFQAFNGHGQALVTVREKTTWQYDALGNAVIQTNVAKNQADNREIRNQYDAAGNLRVQRDANGALITYDYDVGGTVNRSTRQVADVAGVTHTYRTYYAYDKLGRETSRQDIEENGSGVALVVRETQDVRYTAHGDIEAKGINGQYQERYVYDRLGRLFWTNKENGTPRLYIYDANGNAVLEIHAVDKDLSAVITPAAASQLSPTEYQFTTNFYNSRNQLVAVFQPPMKVSEFLSSPPSVSGSDPGLPAEVLGGIVLPNDGDMSRTGGAGYSLDSHPEQISLTSTSSATTFGTPPSNPNPSSISQNVDLQRLNLTVGDTLSPLSIVKSNPITQISADGLTKTVTENETWVSILTQVSVNSDKSVLKKVTTKTDVINRVTIFNRSTSESQNTDDTLEHQWILDKTDQTTTDRTITTKQERITRVETTYKEAKYVYATPGGLSLTPATSFQTDWSQVKSGQNFEWTYSYGTRVTVPAMGGYGSTPTSIKVTYNAGYTQTQSVPASGGQLTFNRSGVPIGSGPIKVEIIRGGVVVASQSNPLSASATQPATTTTAIPALVTLTAQVSTGKSAKLEILNANGTTASTAVVNVASGATGPEYSFFGNYVSGQKYRYTVYDNVNATGAVVNQIQGLLGSTAYDRAYYIKTTKETTETTQETTDKYDEYFAQVTGTYDQVQNTYLKRLVMSLTRGAVTDKEIWRLQTRNAFGEIDTQTDGGLNKTNLVYNDLGQLVARIQPETDIYSESGAVARARPTTRYYYNELGQLVGTQDANSDQLSTSQKYYSTRLLVNGRVEREFDPLGNWKRYVYDALGNQRQSFNELGFETEYQYDRAGQLTRVDFYSENGTPYSYDAYAYDQAGNRISHTNALGDTEKYLFDDQNRIVLHTSFAGRNTQYIYTYQSALAGIGGYEKQTITPGLSGVSAVTDTATDRTDYFGHIRFHQDLGGHQFTYTYNTAGWLKGQTSTTGQNITYSYYYNGLLESIADSGIGSYANFEYDNEGNRTLEYYSQAPFVSGSQNLYPYQFVRAEYDELNRLKRAYENGAEQTGKFAMNYKYDAVGNRRSVEGTYFDLLTGDRQTQNFYYTYDKLNRFAITMGDQVNGQIVLGDAGYQIEYDKAGRRLKVSSRHADEQTGLPTLLREEYTYDPTGTLKDTFVYKNDGSNALLAHTLRDNDVTGRQLNYYEYNGTNQTKYVHYEYDKDSLIQLEENRTDSNRVEKNAYTYINGILQKVNSNLVDSSGQTLSGNVPVIMTYSYLKWDDYKNGSVTVVGDRDGWMAGTSSYQYDVNGHIKEVFDHYANRNITYVSNQDGQVLKRHQIDHEPNGNDKPIIIRQFYLLDGTPIGDSGNDDTPSRVDYAQILSMREKSGKKTFANIPGRVFPVTSGDFDQNYQPIGPNYPSPVPQSYLVNEGDTLRGIALRLWGDGDLWYLIAQANGLMGDEGLVVGTRLTVPNVVTNIHNNSDTFRPFDPEVVLGDTSPTLPDPPPPPPRKNGCGVLGQILMVVVAIVVTVYTAGVAAGGTSAALASGGAATSTWAAGAAALTGGLGTTTASVGAAVIGGAAGSIASQAVGIAAGIQDGFDWKGVALGAIGAGVTAGLGAAVSGTGALGQAMRAITGGNRYAMAALNGATASALTQGISVATGLQKSFSWRNVAISAVAAPVAHGLGTAVEQLLPTVGEFGSRVAAGIGGSLVRRAFGSKEDSATILADAFGNALGNSIVDGMQPRLAGGMLEQGGSAQELQEVGITARYIGSGVEERNARLDNNPINIIWSGGGIALDAVAAGSDAGIAGSIEHVFSTAPKWRPGEEFNYWNLQGSYSSQFGQRLDEDYAAGQAAALYQQDLRDQAAAIGNRNAAMLVNDFTPVGAAVGLYNLGVKTIGGAASALPLLFGRMDTARSWQDSVNQAQVHLPSGVGEMVRSGVNQLRSWSESYMGDGVTTLLGAGLELTGDLLVMAPGTRALRSVTADIELMNRSMQMPLYVDLQGAAAYSSLPIGFRSPFKSMSGPVELTIPAGASAQEVAQIRQYAEIANEALNAGALSSSGRVSTNGILRQDASRAAAIERAQAEAAGSPYSGHVGHVPDTTWTGSAQPYRWLDLSPKVNSSLGGQANRYPIGYQPTEFVVIKP